jgi:glycosyltransferase involved in cell wall biosynthesis
MRIVYIVHQFYPEFQSGTERVTLNLARMAQRAGHHVQVLGCVLDPSSLAVQPHASLADAFSTVVDGVPVTLIDRARLPPMAETSFETVGPVVSAIEQWMRAERFELAHVMHTMRSASAVAAAARAGLPLVLTLTDFFLGCLRVNLTDIDGRLCQGPQGGQLCPRQCPTPAWGAAPMADRHRHAQRLLESAAVCVAPSAYVAERFGAMFPGLECKVISHGVDVLMLASGGSGRPPGSTRVDAPLSLGFFGSIVPTKGLHVLLQALAAEPGLPVRLTVAGAHHGDPGYRQQIQRLASADARVSMRGQLSSQEVAAVMRETDLLCLPSVVPESFSLALHEAAALSVPALVSDLGAPAQAISASGAGRVVAAGDVAAWARALQEACADRQLCERWSRAVPLPQRIEEEAFFYDLLYRRAADRASRTQLG